MSLRPSDIPVESRGLIGRKEAMLTRTAMLPLLVETVSHPRADLGNFRTFTSVRPVPTRVDPNSLESLFQESTQPTTQEVSDVRR